MTETSLMKWLRLLVKSRNSRKKLESDKQELDEAQTQLTEKQALLL